MSMRKRKQPLTTLPELDPFEVDDMPGIIYKKEENTRKIAMKSNGKENLKSKMKVTSLVLTESDSDSDEDIWMSLKSTGVKTQRRNFSQVKTKTEARKQLFSDEQHLKEGARKRKLPRGNSHEKIPDSGDFSARKAGSESSLKSEDSESQPTPSKRTKLHTSINGEVMPDSRGGKEMTTFDIVQSMRNRLEKQLRASEEKIEDATISPVKTSAFKSATPQKRISSGAKQIVTPISRKNLKCETPRTPLEEARVSLHVSAVPTSLPCRESEFQNIHNFIENKVLDGVGGCMYISGVPGTGKTATVTQVIRSLQDASEKNQLPRFNFIEINGMRLADPRQAYIKLYHQILKKKERITCDAAYMKLDAYFNKNDSKKLTTVVLVDELDLMCTRKQDVVYNLLDWPSKSRSRLVVITIANTMDMPERKLKGRVNSRLGLTRLTFLPYTHKQLEEIVMARLQGTDAFVVDAVRLATRKVAAVSGDARRALDICRRAAELPAEGEPVSIYHIEQAIKEMTNSNIVRLIRSCSEMEKNLLRSVCDVCVRTGVEEVSLIQVLDHMQSLCVLEGFPRPSIPSLLNLCHRLKCFRLLFTNNHRAGLLQRLTLNLTRDDIHYALKGDQTKD